MFRMEFMVLYLALIVSVGIFYLSVYFLVLLLVHFIDWIGRIVGKKGK